MRLVILAAGLGTRVAAIAGGRSKLFLECGGRTLLDRHLELARRLAAEPLVVARAGDAADFRRCGAEVLVDDAPASMLGSLHAARGLLDRPFCWIGGDMLFADLQPLVDLAAACSAAGCAGGLLYTRSDSFKAKLRLSPGGEVREVRLTRAGGYELSLPCFMPMAPRLLGHVTTHREDFLTPAIAAGEPLLAREYTAPVFEIDTPADLAAARLALAAGPVA